VEAIVLAGGLGTRLRGVLPDVPKLLAPIAGRPFLDWLLQYLRRQGFTRLVLAIGHRHEQIRDRLRTHAGDPEIAYSVEDTPLGTGGAILAAMDHCESAEVFVINGDTLFAIDHRRMLAAFRRTGASLMVALRRWKAGDRFGRVVLDGDRIAGFVEKGDARSDLINGGVYLIDRALRVPFSRGQAFSFERDFLEAEVGRLRPHAYVEDAFFIDIGIPEDLERAQTDVPTFFRSLEHAGC
jgi:D-glycero-alpha-D-manno-heptose 1-phosphate guanylyltransferase